MSVLSAREFNQNVSAAKRAARVCEAVLGRSKLNWTAA